ncbi:benzoate transporter [Actinoplanes sp. ATCC 53533]|uniref:beta-propeller domain-containing protein n=1 Tax=Actinoplanes sp. ATCC 53533 TaxID=1288362 RepID=UPI000F796AA7|nr:beta-propeller domain-containing protein [Actinoplanes sp. ATCC 53533]RSM50373.1 benzoate transporter [Actinoplanes sp. ATCC 53533]
MSHRLLFCAVLALAVPLAGCTASKKPPAAPPPSAGVGGAMRLVAFDSCEQLFADLRKAAKANVGPYGLPGNQMMDRFAMSGGARSMADAAGAEAQRAAPAPGFSGTNVHEQGADEPDLIKTDGRRIVTISEGVLRVIDTATRKQTGEVDLDVGPVGDLQLLLTGDSALVLVPSIYNHPLFDAPFPVDQGVRILLVNLTGKPSVVSRYTGEGSLVDARMTGGTARIVLRSSPRIAFPLSYRKVDEKKLIAGNRAVIDKTPDAAWLPQWSVTDSSGTTRGETDCRRVSRPTDFSGGAMVSILTFDLTRPTLGSGDPVAVVADGDTVYATPDSLYLANDDRWRYDLFPGRVANRVRQQTELFKFALAGNQPPVYRASGTVPGYLLNQYAMSEWDSHLRVATTDPATDRSAVRVFAERDGKLVQTGIADGLGKGERIYSVRFVGARGYVVTFKQTDPLYSLDLRDPAKPAVTGELKITGYSAHLQPVGENRLVGIGQEADANGRTQGLQVSLFDVADPAHPKRLAQYHLPQAYSNAEYDPHALLWWPTTQLLVVPVESRGALALRVTDDITLADQLDQPELLRSLVVGTELWTLSQTGLRASDLSTMDQLAWVPLS